MNEKQHRKSFRQQPSHYLLLDIGFPMTASSIQGVCVAVQNILALAASVRGKSRIPTFGFVIINSHYQVCYKINYLRGNFPSIFTVLETIANQTVFSVKTTTEEYRDLLRYALLEMIKDFNAGMATEDISSRQWNQSWPTQLQITVVTMKNGLSTCALLQDILQSKAALIKLKCVEVMQISDPTTGHDILAGKDILYYKTSGYLKLTICQNTPSAFDTFFKYWMLESNSEQEHVRLILQRDPDIILKCDMNECMINPVHLPFGHRFTLYNDVPNIITGSNHVKTSGSDVSVFELKVINTVSSAGVCPTVLLGCPRYLRATQSWALTWSESNVNQQLFTALCRKLAKDDYVLITKLKSLSSFTDMLSYFMITSDGEALMISSIAPQELVLPRFNDQQQNIEEEAISLVDNALSHIPYIQEYQPQNFKTGLYGNLKNNLKKTNKTTKTDMNVEKAKKSNERKVTTVPKTTSTVSVPPGQYVPQFKNNPSPDNRKRDAIHPAFCSPSTKAKYRRKGIETSVPYEDEDTIETFKMT